MMSNRLMGWTKGGKTFVFHPRLYTVKLRNQTYTQERFSLLMCILAPTPLIPKSPPGS